MSGDTEKQRKTIVTAYRRTRRHTAFVPNQSVETPSKQSETLLAYSEWAIEQRKLVLSLGLTRITNFVGRECRICRRPVPKQANIELCVDHREAWRRYNNMLRQRRFRERHLNNGRVT